MKLKQLYRFTENDLVWTYTSSDVEESYNGELYTPVTISRDEPEVRNELSRANIEVKLPIENDLAKRNMLSLVEAQVSLTVFSIEEDLTVSVEWKGRLAQIKPDGGDCVLVFESIFTSLRRPGVRRRFQRSCPHVLYGNRCKVLREDYAAVGAVTGVNGQIVTMAVAALQPDGYYTGGMIEASDGTLRYIISHVGSTLVLIRKLELLATELANNGYGTTYGTVYGQAGAIIYPGCDRTKETCLNKFNNIDNNGSFPFIPLRNPMDGRSIV